MFISLSSSFTGNACAIRDSINTYITESGENQFFDYLVTSMKSVNQILEGKEIQFESDYIYPNPLDMTSINFKDFDLITSHHDIKEFNNNSITEITEKYNRRYNRLINLIKNKDKIYFIRYCRNTENLEEDEIHKFYQNIKSINPFLSFYFILISDDDSLKIPTSLSKENFIYINLNKHITQEAIDEEDYYQKIIKTYKCVFEIVKN